MSMKRVTRNNAQRSGEPELATAADLTGALPVRSGRDHARQTTARKPGRINLRAVADALAEEGLDPAVEIPRILQAQQPVLDRQGNPVFNPDGTPRMEDVVDADTKLRTMTELLSYLQPKLKAVEVKMSGTLDLTEDQLNQRLSALLAKAVRT
jgi:hypothetical protein